MRETVKGEWVKAHRHIQRTAVWCDRMDEKSSLLYSLASSVGLPKA